MMINKFNRLTGSLLIAVLVLLSLFSCKKNMEKTNHDEFDDKVITEGQKVISTGEEYTVVVINELSKTHPELANIMDSFYGFETPVLPQKENYFYNRLVGLGKLTPELQQNLAIFILHIPDESPAMLSLLKDQLPELLELPLDSSFYRVIDNHWAYPQKVIYVQAPDFASLTHILYEYRYSFIEEFEKFETMRLKRRVYAHGRNNSATDKLYRSHKINLSIPKGYINIMDKIPSTSDTLLSQLKISGLSWFRNKNKAFNTNLLIYYAPLSGLKQANASDYLAIKDHISKMLVHGANSGSYCKTAYTYNPPQAIKTTLGGKKATLFRGLWETEGDWMGGPFIFYAIEDPTNRRMIFIDAFVYAPGLEKKLFMKRLEVTLETLR